MNQKDFKRLQERDQYCLHCGEGEAVAPNHRANRGMGGSKLSDVPSNIVLLCSRLNGLIESDAYYQKMAFDNGWKVSKWADWREIPVRDVMSGAVYLLNDDWSRNVIDLKGNL